MKKLFSNWKIRLLLSLIFLFTSLSFLSLILKPNFVTKQATEQEASSVLGSNYYQTPQIFISGGDPGYSNGGMIAQASTDEPAVVIGGYNISGQVEITMYEADETSLINYLIHDKDGKQTKKAPDTSKFKYVTSVKQNINTSSYQGSKVPLPFRDTGIWYLKVKTGSVSADAYVLRSDIGVLAKEGDNEFIFWSQNFKTKRSISAGTVKILNLQDQTKELQTVSFTAEGIAKAKLTAQADIALIAQDENRAIVPLNLKYLNTGYSYKDFQEKVKETKYFIFTDRPIYKPGDTMYFKSILRDDDDARYSIPSGNVLVKIYPGYDEKNAILEKSFPISAEGTINGEYNLPKDVKVGYYTLSVRSPTGTETYSSVYFDVEFYKKPEFSINVSTTQTDFIAGDKTSFKISGTYFSGQPLAGQKIKYSVNADDFYEYQYLTDKDYFKDYISSSYRYGSWYGNNKVAENVAILDENGEVEISLDTKMSFNQGKTQVFSINATLDDGSQTPAFSRKNILVYAGEYGIYRKDTSYGVRTNTPLTLPVILTPNKAGYKTAGINLSAKVHRTNWISYQDPTQKYPAYRKEEEDLPSLSAKTDQGGNAIFSFTPTKTGSYNIAVSGQDGRGNLISKVFYSYVTADNQPYYSENGNSELTISTDKQKYLPTDTVKFNIFSQIPDRDVFLSMERGRVSDFQVIRLIDKSGTINIPLADSDIPNIFANVSSFSASTLDSNQINIPVSPESKKLIVGITPNSKTYGPGETATVNVTTTDIAGNPISADLSLWTVDKAIFELTYSRLGDIFKVFWDERYNRTQEAHSLEGILVRNAEMGGGCFAPGTKVLMDGGKSKNIEEVKVGDYILTRISQTDPKLTKAKVLNNQTAEEGGVLILNGTLKVTANHIMWAEGTWKEAGSIQIGDTLKDQENNPIYIRSIEWQKGKTPVYNLEIEKYSTFFADNVWVHNQKGIDRQTFKDTAYWNPSIHTDSSGRAQVSFRLPDNLTTWTIAAVAATANTMVGQTTNEIVVTKDIVVRPILPNILRTGDEIILSTLVQNFTQNDHQFDVGLKFDAGSVEEEIRPDILIPANKMEQFYFKVKPEKETEKSKLIFSAKAKDDKDLADIVTQEIPVKAFGWEEKYAESGEGAKTFALALFADSYKEKSKVSLSISPTIIGTLPTAMKYLIDYPYGCVEQTTSRFVPAVIAKLNQDLFKQALADKDIDGIINKGLSRLSSLHQWDGGWSWWQQGKSDSFITAYVVEYLLAAKQAGIKVDDGLISRAKDFFLQDKAPGREIEVARIYALTLLGEKSKVKQITDFNLSPDLLSMAVMANYLNGNIDPKSNGLNTLVSMAQVEGDSLFWNAGNKINFGSNDASTAMAIRAILLANGDRSLAVQGARFLNRARRSEYWSNTYATAQVIRALVELSKSGDELTPNYTYTVSLDGKQIAQGSVTNAKQVIPEISIPAAKIKSDGSNISISKTGDGQIYSTLAINEFRTDKNAKAVNHGLSVKREYVNAKGPEYSLGVGETAIVKITVGGLKANEYYGVVNDELPSGLVPINESFLNEQYGNTTDTYYNSFDVTDKDTTENGMTLSLYQIAPIERTYTYRARVTSEGTFIVPPVTASLMYAPEISGRSEVQTIKITKKSQFFGKANPETAVKNNNRQILYAAVLIAIISVIVVLKLKRKSKNDR